MTPLLAILLASAPAAPAAPPLLSVLPGSVVRWSAPGTTRCEHGGESWAAEDGVCLFGVDLDTPPGRLAVRRVRGTVREEGGLLVGEAPWPVETVTVDPRKVHLSAKDAQRVKRENERAAAVYARRTPRLFTPPLAPPLDPLPSGRNFGTKRVLNGEPRSRHGGVDYAAAPGTPVRAMDAGRVALVGDFLLPGRCVFVDHGGGLVTMAMHLSRIDVKEGADVARGTILGLSGASGRVSGPHLHLGMRLRGARVDPRALLADPGALPALP